MKYIIGKHTLLGLLAVALVLLTGCQSDGADTTPRQAPTMEMQAYATTYVDAESRASTRAGEWVPDGFTLYEGQDVIRVAFTQGNKFAESYKDNQPIGKNAEGIFQFKQGEGKWGSSFYLPQVSVNDYYLYGFMPNVGNLSKIDPIDGVYGESGDFANGAKLSITELPTATTDDICVIVGVKKGVVIGTNPEKDPEDPAYNIYGLLNNDPIQMGQFAYKIEGGQNHVYLLCDHLYAALGLKIRVNSTYHALRHIWLKKVWVKDYTIDGITYTSKSRVDVTLKNNYPSPIQEPILFARDGTSSVTDMQSLLYKSAEAEGLPLTTTYQEVQGYMAPIGMTDFTLVTQYDVYDTNGNLIRKDQKAENRINIKSLFGNDHPSFLRGTRYILQLTVNPTYLYMMSEPDLDNPTVEIVSNGD